MNDRNYWASYHTYQRLFHQGRVMRHIENHLWFLWRNCLLGWWLLAIVTHSDGMIKVVNELIIAAAISNKYFTNYIIISSLHIISGLIITQISSISNQVYLKLLIYPIHLIFSLFFHLECLFRSSPLLTSAHTLEPTFSLDCNTLPCSA